MPTCVLCGYQDDVEICGHLRSEHRGGLPQYQLFFPSSRVVSSDLFAGIENAVHFKYADPKDEDLARITEEERRLIIENVRNHAAPRSEVIVEPDF